MPLSNDAVLSRLVQGMDASSLRQDTTAHNLANLNTPRFNRSYVSFEENLRQAQEKEGQLSMQATNPRHFHAPGPAEVAPQVKKDDTTAHRIDGNNVDLEREMTNMVKNQLKFNALSDQTSNRVNTWA